MTEQELMLTHIRKCRRIDLYIDPRPLDSEEQLRLQDLQAQRQAGEPLQYLFGECEFMGFKFLVNLDVLIPRPETELLVELAVEKLLSRIPQDRALRILDLGTGSGNIAVTLAKLIPNSEITTIDCSLEALAVGRRNAQINGVQKKIEFVQGDMLTQFVIPECFNRGSREWIPAFAGMTGRKYDLIISNPPYIPSAQLNRLPPDVRHEPQLALDGGEDGLKFYRHILANAGAYLVEGGLLVMEIGDGQRAALEAMLREHKDFSGFEFYPDYRGTDRILAAYCK